MPATAKPNLGLMEGWNLGEDGWNIDMNANLRKLDCLTQCRVTDKDLTTPPGSPTDGVAYIVPAGGTGAWAGRATNIARYYQGGATWEFYVPRSGWEAYVLDENVKYRFNGAAWVLA